MFRQLRGVQGRMHLAWDYLHMVADNGNVALLELRERIYNTGSADIPQDAAPPVLPYQQESVIPQAPPAGEFTTPASLPPPRYPIMPHSAPPCPSPAPPTSFQPKTGCCHCLSCPIISSPESLRCCCRFAQHTLAE